MHMDEITNAMRNISWAIRDELGTQNSPATQIEYLNQQAVQADYSAQYGGRQEHVVLSAWFTHELVKTMLFLLKNYGEHAHD
jgi:hypothetical protein